MVSDKKKTMKISKICCETHGKSQKALCSAIPVVNEQSLSHDESGYSYNSGSFMVMEAMMWNQTMVTTRRLHKVPPPGAVVDMLVRESIYMSRLRHPNVLLLVAMCRTSNPESLVLLYERVYLGSLHQFLYQKYEMMAVWEMCALMRQICSAVSYLHENDLLHTAINSHSIHMVSQNLVKLGNLEYMVENKEKQGLQTKSMVTPTQETSYLFHWTAPEMLAEKPISVMSDLYSLCAVVWEILHGSIPWVGLHVEEIKCKVLIQKKRLPIDEEFLEPPFNIILQQGLSMYPSCRKITVSDLQIILTRIVNNRDQINLSQQNVTPKKRTRMRVEQPRCKNHQRKCASERSFAVSFDDTDGAMYASSIKSSTPARAVQSARQEKTASPPVPPRRRLSKATKTPEAVAHPEDIIQMSISSIEGSQKEASPAPFARSLSQGSRVQQLRHSLTSDLNSRLSSERSLPGKEPAVLTPPASEDTTVLKTGKSTLSILSAADTNSSAVRRSLFQGPKPYRPSNSVSGMTKVSFSPNISKEQILNSSGSCSLSQMPQLTSSSLSNGPSTNGQFTTTPSESPIVMGTQVQSKRLLHESNPTFRLSKTLSGYTKHTIYGSEIASARQSTPCLKSIKNEVFQSNKSGEEIRVIKESTVQIKGSNSGALLRERYRRYPPLQFTNSEGSSVSHVTSSSSCSSEKAQQEITALPVSLRKNMFDDDAKKAEKKDQFDVESRVVREPKYGITVKDMATFFHQKAQEHNQPDVR